MAEAHIMLRYATGFRVMEIFERFSNPFHILPAVGVFKLGVTASESIFHLSTDIQKLSRCGSNVQDGFPKSDIPDLSKSLGKNQRVS
jgi:hypothetical protein